MHASLCEARQEGAYSKQDNRFRVQEPLIGIQAVVELAASFGPIAINRWVKRACICMDCLKTRACCKPCMALPRPRLTPCLMGWRTTLTGILSRACCSRLIAAR